MCVCGVGGGGGGHSNCNASQPNVQKNSRGEVRGVGLKSWKKIMLENQPSPHLRKKLGIDSPVLFHSPPTQ